MSKFYFAHVNSLIKSKTEKRAVISKITVILAQALYYQKYRQDSGTNGNLAGVLVNNQACPETKRYLEEFYSSMGIPADFNDEPMDEIVYKLSKIDEFVFFKKLFS